MKNNSQIYVFDTESGELYTDGIVHESYSEKILSRKLGGFEPILPPNENEEEENKRFVFLTQKDVNDIIIQHLTFRNPIVDNLRFQKKYEFDKEPIDTDKLHFRMDLLKEEYEETLSALENKDAEEFVDGLTDLVVIALGTLHLSGVSVNKAWSEVYRANMSKVRGVKPGREQSGGFDVIKPEGWKAPDHSDNHGDLDGLLSKT